MFKKCALTPLASLFCRKAEWPAGPRPGPNNAFGNFAFSFASSNFSNSFGCNTQVYNQFGNMLDSGL